MMESFETYRSYLFAIAYRMLGSAMDAEDMVQETYLRYQTTPKDSITSLKAFLTTIISRLCVDQLQLAHRKRDVYLGPWLPELSDIGFFRALPSGAVRERRSGDTPETPPGAAAPGPRRKKPILERAPRAPHHAGSSQSSESGGARRPGGVDFSRIPAAA